MKEQLIELLKKYVSTYRIKNDAAKHLNITLQDLSQILNGHKAASLDKIIRLCEKAGYKITLEIEQ